MKNTRQYQRLTVSFIHTRKQLAKTKVVWSGIRCSLQGSHLSKKDHSGKLPRLVLNVNTSKGRNVSVLQARKAQFKLKEDWQAYLSSLSQGCLQFVRTTVWSWTDSMGDT